MKDDNKTGSPDPGAAPLHIEAVARELERMAAHATHRDHFESPIVDAIARAPSARPFEGALRALVAKLTQEREHIPRSSIVSRLVRDSDLHVAVKLDLLHELLLANAGLKWDSKWRQRQIYTLEEAGLSDVLHVLRAGGRAALDPLIGWLRDPRQLVGSVRLEDIVERLLTILAEDDPTPVLDALMPLAAPPETITLVHMAHLHPEEALALARRRVDAGATYPAAIALLGLVEHERLHEQARVLATTIASDPKDEGSMLYALQTLIHLPEVEPQVWEWLRRRPERYRQEHTRVLGARVRDGLVPALEVLEYWMREPGASASHVGHICAALGTGVWSRTREGTVPVSFEKRVLRDAEEAWRLGATARELAFLVEFALSEADDARYEALEIDELVCRVAAADGSARHGLMYAVMTNIATGGAWPTRLLMRIAAEAGPEEREKLASDLEGYSPREPWVTGALRVLRARSN